MFTAFTTALSALSAHAAAIDVVGNNLANMNTTGYKTSVVNFYDLVTQSLGPAPSAAQAGFGVGRPTVYRQFTQGAIQKSSGALDVAIQGDGFLVVRDDAGANLYTRGGHLQVDKNGVLRTSTGERVQGWMGTGGVISTTGPVGDIVIPVGALKAPKATTKFSFDLNLNAAAVQGDTFSTSIEVYDSLGNSHVVTVTFTKTANPNEWSYLVDVPGQTVTGSPTGLLQFDSAGHLVAPANWPSPLITVAQPTTGAAQMDLNWDLYQGATARLTQYAQASAVAANAQDGSPAAQLVRVGMTDGGIVLAQYSSGEQEAVAQLAMAAIRNPELLTAAGNNNYQLNAQTALPAIGLPGTGGRGIILGSALENSTVDLAKEFTNLIVYQRGYQASTRVVTAADELSQETINLKR
jgi:flagellar hook protein FlgE